MTEWSSIPSVIWRVGSGARRGRPTPPTWCRWIPSEDDADRSGDGDLEVRNVPMSVTVRVGLFRNVNARGR